MGPDGKRLRLRLSKARIFVPYQEAVRATAPVWSFLIRKELSMTARCSIRVLPRIAAATLLVATGAASLEHLLSVGPPNTERPPAPRSGERSERSDDRPKKKVRLFCDSCLILGLY